MLKRNSAPEIPDESDPSLSSGQRERNKREKLQRIRNAARELFVSKGYEDTTTREIATRASVGMGTVFTYADNKRDLLFLIANEDLAEVVRLAAIEAHQETSMLGGLLAFFRAHYRYFAQQPELSRLMLREMVFYDSGAQANRFRAMREQFMSSLHECVRLAKERGQIASAEDCALIGWVIFCLYQVEVRRWLAEGTLDIAEGMARLERAIGVVVTGLQAHDVSSPASGAKKQSARRGR